MTDLRVLDSALHSARVSELQAEALGRVQTDALCTNRGLPDFGSINNFTLAIQNGPQFEGIWMLGCVDYVSGPWNNTTEWLVTSPGAPVVLEGVPMTGLRPGGAPIAEEALLGAELAARFLNPAGGLTTGQDKTVYFSRLHYGIFLAVAGPIADRAKLHHAAIVADPRINVATALHPTIAGLTLVEATWA